jgi:hypothetical protein
MSTITVFPSLTAASSVTERQIAPNAAARFIPVAQPGPDRARRQVSTRLQALREGATARVETMTSREDTPEELEERADTTRDMQWAQSQTRIWQGES